jgi:hypothetical protein
LPAALGLLLLTAVPATMRAGPLQGPALREP